MQTDGGRRSSILLAGNPAVVMDGSRAVGMLSRSSLSVMYEKSMLHGLPGLLQGLPGRARRPRSVRFMLGGLFSNVVVGCPCVPCVLCVYSLFFRNVNLRYIPAKTRMVRWGSPPGPLSEKRPCVKKCQKFRAWMAKETSPHSQGSSI
jgi:hypothetical protein